MTTAVYTTIIILYYSPIIYHRKPFEIKHTNHIVSICEPYMILIIHNLVPIYTNNTSI